MPELPEVETTRRGLQRRLPGARIDQVEVRESRLRWGVDRAALEALEGARLVAVRRQAKYLLVETDSEQTLLMHLGMSGRMVLTAVGEELDRHDHVVWQLQAEAGARIFELRFRDPRRFGCVLVVPTRSLMQHALLSRLGPDPLGPGFTGAYLHARSRRSRRPVKNFLMDAHVVTGIGNIYASEALWQARVNPKVRAGRISAARFDRVRDACVGVLEAALLAGGTTLSDYRDAEGSLGYFGVQLQVYGREGEDCARCGHTIRREVMSGRSTYSCAGCQH